MSGCQVIKNRKIRIICPNVVKLNKPLYLGSIIIIIPKRVKYTIPVSQVIKATIPCNVKDSGMDGSDGNIPIIIKKLTEIIEKTKATRLRSSIIPSFDKTLMNFKKKGITIIPEKIILKLKNNPPSETPNSLT
jgi:hypothetical protein